MVAKKEEGKAEEKAGKVCPVRDRPVDRPVGRGQDGFRRRVGMILANVSITTTTTIATTSTSTASLTSTNATEPRSMGHKSYDVFTYV